MDEEDSYHNLFKIDAEFSDDIMKEQNALDESNQMYSPPKYNENFPEKLTLKAFNPVEASKSLPEKQRDQYLKMMENGKFHPGLIQIFQQENDQRFPDFLDNMRSNVIEREEDRQPLFLNHLFDPENHDEMQLAQKQHMVLKNKLNSISQKFVDSAHLHKCTSQSFFERFDNFSYLHGQQNFLKDFQIGLINIMQQGKRIKGPSMELVLEIYDFWLKMFKNFVQQIYKYNQKYTLNFIKKNVQGKNSSNYQANSSNNLEIKSSNSSKLNEFDKRKPWKTSELEVLQKIISSQTIFSTAMISKLAQELNRSTASISCKLQKMAKSKKNQNPDFIVEEGATLFDKVYAVLKNYTEGLSRQSVLERINQHYEMGGDDGWMKSAAQILSSRGDFVKIKGLYGLDGNHEFDMTKKTFKDKVVNCLVKCPNQKGDLKRLIDIYIDIYGKYEGGSILSEQRRKEIEASFSKALSRYSIFDKSQSRTIYKLRQYLQPQDYQMEIQSYIA